MYNTCCLRAILDYTLDYSILYVTDLSSIYLFDCLKDQEESCSLHCLQHEEISLQSLQEYKLVFTMQLVSNLAMS